MDEEKVSWFSSHIGILHRIAESPDQIGAMLAYHELVVEYLDLFPNSTFNFDYSEYLKQI